MGGSYLSHQNILCVEFGEEKELVVEDQELHPLELEKEVSLATESESMRNYLKCFLVELAMGFALFKYQQAEDLFEWRTPCY